MGSAIAHRRFGSGGYVFDETPSGSINGSNVNFSTTNNFSAGSLRVYKNGVRMEEGASNDFTVTGANDFAMTTAPATGTKILVDYHTVTTSSGNAATLAGYEYDYLRSPIGTVSDFAGSSAPENWLLCYGQAVSRTTYAALFAVLGTTYGSGDLSTTFNLPDCRGRVVAGKDNMGGTSANRLTDLAGGLDGDVLGDYGGAETHTLTTPEMPSHTHTLLRPTWYASEYVAGGTIYSQQATTSAAVSAGTGVNSTGGGGAHNNVQPTIIFNKIIRAL